MEQTGPYYFARQPQLAPYLRRENALLTLRNRTHGEDHFLSENAERTFFHSARLDYTPNAP